MLLTLVSPGWKGRKFLCLGKLSVSNAWPKAVKEAETGKGLINKLNLKKKFEGYVLYHK